MWANPDGTTIPDAAFQGAGPDSGEVTDIAIDPRGTADKNLYIATNDGGIWKTADDGSTNLHSDHGFNAVAFNGRRGGGSLRIHRSCMQAPETRSMAAERSPRASGSSASHRWRPEWGIVDGGILDTIFAGMLINRIIVP